MALTGARRSAAAQAAFVATAAVLSGLLATPAAAQAGSADTAARRVATATSGLIPPGFGTLRNEDVAIVAQIQGLTVRAMPLDEAVIRALAPDRYQSLHAMRESRSVQIERIRTRLGLAAVHAWHVVFFNVQQGEARFDPRGMQIRSAGRDFRPLDVLPLQPGFEDGRLAQGRMAEAIFVFDPAVALDQPLVVTIAGQQSAAWSEELLQRIARERAAIWSRAAAARRP